LDTVVSVNKIKDLVEGSHVDVFELLVDSHCLDDGLVALPDQLELVPHLGLSLLDLGVQAVQDDFGRGFIDLDIGKRADDGQVSSGDFLLEDGLELLVAVVLEDVLEGLGVLTLSDGSVGLEDVLDGGVHVGFEGQLDEFILNEGKVTASFSRLRLQVILRLVALVRYS
jgi:hypothetical protein